jgi:hypothetical protein
LLEKFDFLLLSNNMDADDIRLRDQFAIAAMQALLGQYKQNTTYFENGTISSNGTEYSKSGNTSTNTSSYESEDNSLYLQRINSKIELISHLSYKMADEMRKARLKSFT